MFDSHLDELMKKIVNQCITICSRHDIAEIQIKWRYTPINQSIISFLSKMTSSVDMLGYERAAAIGKAKLYI
jgi:hypothetical protein